MRTIFGNNRPQPPQIFSLIGRTHVANSYGLFRVMTKSRPELLIEGSHDGKTWRPYVFKWKPGPVDRPPAFVEPYMPRLDWQMWFAALSVVEQNRIPSWLLTFAERLGEGSPEVLGLLETNPFPQEPPTQIRFTAYQYNFTDAQMRSTTGAWWTRNKIFSYPLLDP